MVCPDQPPVDLPGKSAPFGVEQNTFEVLPPMRRAKAHQQRTQSLGSGGDFRAVAGQNKTFDALPDLTLELPNGALVKTKVQRPSSATLGRRQDPTPPPPPPQEFVPSSPLTGKISAYSKTESSLPAILDSVEDSSDESDVGESESIGSKDSVVLNQPQNELLEALKAKSALVVPAWESHGRIDVPAGAPAVVVVSSLPAQVEAHDVVEELAAQKLQVPVLVLLLRPQGQCELLQAPALGKEVGKFLQLGADDVVLQPGSSTDVEATIEMWLACGNERLFAAQQLRKDSAKKESEMQEFLQCAAEREDELFWEMTHVIFNDLPKLSRTVQEPAIGGMVGHQHTVTELINTGGFSDVFLVKDAKRQTRALKAVKKGKLGRYDLVECIAREIRVLRKLRHPNVVRFFGSAHTCEHLIVLMEYAGRRNIFNVLKDHQCGTSPISPTQVQHLFRQMVLAVGYCHSQGISHRDIKPENFAVADSSDCLKLVDFGMANNLDAPLLHKGTMPFICPEVLAEDLQCYDSGKADIWSVGVVLLEMICGLNALCRIMNWKDGTAPELARANELVDFFSEPGKFGDSVQEHLRSDMSYCEHLNALVNGMMSVDIDSRFDAPTILQSSWFQMWASPVSEK